MTALAPLWHFLSGSTSRYLPFVVFLAIVCIADVAFGQALCNSTAEVERTLRGKFHEEICDQYAAGGQLYQLWLNFWTGSGSLVVRHAGGMSCIVLPLEDMLPTRRVNL